MLDPIPPPTLFALIKDLAEFKLTLDLLDYLTQSAGRGIKRARPVFSSMWLSGSVAGRGEVA